MSLKHSAVVLVFVAWGCAKTPTAPTDTTPTEQEILTDFATVLAIPNYADLRSKAATLEQCVQSLQSSPTDSNLGVAQSAWRNARSAWEMAEGYLFGPVEDFNYDPTMDTWPVSKTELDSLLASSNPLSLSDIDLLPYSLKGFHAIEYILFGVGNASALSVRQLEYLASLSQSLYNTTTSLYLSWDPTQQNNFSSQLESAGAGSTRFATRKDAFLAIVGAMSDICDEVANNKMEAPLLAKDSTLDESAFSHNSTNDFRSNITGVLNAYRCEYTSQGSSMSDLVRSKNLALDNLLTSQLNAAVTSFSALSSNYEVAIYTQQVQIHNTQNAINALKSTIDNELTNFILTSVKD
jgi:putative iron-regulated protein